LLGITQPHVSGYERGTLRLHGDLIVKLTQILGVSADELLGITPTAKPGPVKGLRFLHRLERINSLPKRDRDALARIINSFLAHAKPLDQAA
jgi:transcriptional regulator with XRE-family HTH domain